MRPNWWLGTLVVALTAVGVGMWSAFGTILLGNGRISPHHIPVFDGDGRSKGDLESKVIRGDTGTSCGNVSAGEICFSDGSAVNINWRPQPDFEGAPLAPFAPHFSILAGKAQSGDTKSAFSLFDMLEQCVRAHQSEAELNDAVELLYQTHHLQTPDQAEPRRMASPEKIPMIESMLRQDFQNCNGLSRAQIDGRDAWLEIASTGDMPHAKLIYAATQEDHYAALSYFEAAWAMGEIDALPSMASIFRHQYDIGEEPTFKVKAYATYLAYARLLEATMGPGTGHGLIADRQVERVQQGLNDRAGELVQYELDDANRIAFELVSSNKACCFRH